MAPLSTTAFARVGADDPAGVCMGLAWGWPPQGPGPVFGPAPRDTESRLGESNPRPIHYE